MYVAHLTIHNVVDDSRGGSVKMLRMPIMLVTMLIMMLMMLIMVISNPDTLEFVFIFYF